VLEQTIAERMSSAPERRRWALTTLGKMAARRAFAEHRAMSDDRFATGRRRGEAFHLGDEARFALFLAGDPIEASRLAQENWRVQQSPSDVRILYEAAVAAGDSAAAGKALAYLTRAGMDAMRLSRLASRASGSSVPGRRPVASVGSTQAMPRPARASLRRSENTGVGGVRRRRFALVRTRNSRENLLGKGREDR
jgi:hypothetical protein